MLCLTTLCPPWPLPFLALQVGHTIQGAGINGACDGRVLRIDVGMSSGCGDGQVEVLVIEQDSQVGQRPGQRLNHRPGQRHGQRPGQTFGWGDAVPPNDYSALCGSLSFCQWSSSAACAPWKHLRGAHASAYDGLTNAYDKLTNAYGWLRICRCTGCRRGSRTNGWRCSRRPLLQRHHRPCLRRRGLRRKHGLCSWLRRCDVIIL